MKYKMNILSFSGNLHKIIEICMNPIIFVGKLKVMQEFHSFCMVNHKHIKRTRIFILEASPFYT